MQYEDAMHVHGPFTIHVLFLTLLLTYYVLNISFKLDFQTTCIIIQELNEKISRVSTHTCINVLHIISNGNNSFMLACMDWYCTAFCFIGQRNDVFVSCCSTL